MPRRLDFSLRTEFQAIAQQGAKSNKVRIVGTLHKLGKLFPNA